MQSESPFAPRRQAPNRSMPPPHVRRVVREDWLGEQPDAKPPPYKPPSVQRRSPTSYSKASSASEKRKTASIEPPAPNKKVGLSSCLRENVHWQQALDFGDFDVHTSFMLICCRPVVPKLYKSRPTFQNINFRIPHNSACISKYLEKSTEKTIIYSRC